MNIFERINYMTEQHESKAMLEDLLKAQNKRIEIEQQACSHVIVNLGYLGLEHPDGNNVTGNACRCLICGRKEYNGVSTDEYVMAGEYLPQYDIRSQIQRNAKFENIQTLALGIARGNQNITNKELVSQLNALIQYGITQRDNQEKAPQLVKTLPKE